MRRWVKLALIALPWGLLALLGWQQLRDFDIFAIEASTGAHRLARAAFLGELAYQGCVSRDAAIITAEARGWTWRDAEPGLCLAPDGLRDWLALEVTPALPFSTAQENDLFLGFDGQGCLTHWRQATGPGSTCPDF